MDYFAVNPDHANDDGLQDIWREMNLAMECSREEAVVDPPLDVKSEDECDHSFILRDDIGLFCCVCGFIQRSIETIIDFQWNQYMPMEGNEHGDEVHEAGLVLSEEMQDKKPNGGVEDDEEDKEHSHGNDDGLQDIWREMNMAMECSKEAVVDHPLDGRSEDECDHSFIFRDDIGHFCSVCGFIQRSIETIIDFQYVKIDRLEIPRRGRLWYMREHSV